MQIKECKPKLCSERTNFPEHTHMHTHNNNENSFHVRVTNSVMRSLMYVPHTQFAM